MKNRASRLCGSTRQLKKPKSSDCAPCGINGTPGRGNWRWLNWKKPRAEPKMPCRAFLIASKRLRLSVRSAIGCEVSGADIAKLSRCNQHDDHVRGCAVTAN